MMTGILNLSKVPNHTIFTGPLQTPALVYVATFRRASPGGFRRRRIVQRLRAKQASEDSNSSEFVVWAEQGQAGGSTLAGGAEPSRPA